MKTKNLLLNGALTLAVMGLGACKMGPNYSREEMPLPTAFRGGSASQESIADLPWWKVLRNNDLQALLTETYQNNKDLGSMMARVEKARQYVTIAHAPMFPWVGYNGYASKGANNMSGNTVAMGGTTTSPGAVAGSVSWEMDIWGKTRRQTESAEAEYFASQEGERSLMLSLLRQVADGYLRLLQLDEKLSILQESVQSYAESLHLFETQMTGGIGDILQVSSAKAALASSHAQIPAVEMEIASLENTLSVLAGRAPGKIRRSGNLSKVSSIKVPSGIPAYILARRPDVRQSEQLLRSANAQIGVAITNYFPSISLTSSAGLVSADLTQAQTHGNSWGVGANFTGPLFQAGSLRASEKAARASFLDAKNIYEKTVLGALSEVSTALIQRSKCVSMLEQQVQAVAAYRAAVTASFDRYKQGVSNYIDVLYALQNLFPALVQLSEYRYQYATTIPTLYAALGGGWNMGNPQMKSGK